jgi:hypothetical protein
VRDDGQVQVEGRSNGRLSRWPPEVYDVVRTNRGGDMSGEAAMTSSVT